MSQKGDHEAPNDTGVRDLRYYDDTSGLHGLDSGPCFRVIRVLLPAEGSLVHLQPDVLLLPVCHLADRVVCPA